MEEILISGLFFSFNLKQTNKKKIQKTNKKCKWQEKNIISKNFSS